MTDEFEDLLTYKVVVNHEEQYSIWPSERENPNGWRDAGKVGKKAECLAYITEVWNDMRPLSLRKLMEERAANPPQPVPLPVDNTPPLVERLSQGQHPVEFFSRVQRTPAGLKEKIESGFVHINFPATRGGTALGIRLDRDAIDLSRADFEGGAGDVTLVGSLTLDGTPVRCFAVLDLATLKGTGYLQPVVLGEAGK